MDALSSWVTRHRMIVGLLWLAITIVGVLLAPSVSGRLKSGNHLHSAAYTADVQIAKQYGGATSDPGVLTLNLPARQTVHSPGVQAELKAVDAGLSKAAPTVRIVSYASTGSRTLVGTGGTSTVVLAYPPKTGEDIDTASLDTLTHAATASAPHLTVHGTSLKALAAGTTSSGGNSTVLSELLVGALGALIVLAWVFGSLLAFLPLIMALVSVLTMQLFIFALTYLVPSSSPLNPAVQYIVALLGLGLSIDYCLLVVTRWREERAAGKSNDEAVKAAMKRAHMLYETVNPHQMREPAGTIIVSDATYAALDDRRVRVEGSHFEPADQHTNKLEGSAITGYETMSFVGIRDPHILASIDQWAALFDSVVKARVQHVLGLTTDKYAMDLRLYGHNAILGAADPHRGQPHEVGVMLLTSASDQVTATAIAKVANPLLLHLPLPGATHLPSFAFATSPAETERGAAYGFVLNHVVAVDSPTELFRTVLDADQIAMAHV